MNLKDNQKAQVYMEGGKEKWKQYIHNLKNKTKKELKYLLKG